MYAADTSTEQLYQAYRTLKQDQPKLRARALAKELQITEAELVAIRQDDETKRLKDDFQAMFDHFPKLKTVMALTRNEAAVNERHGRYLTAHFDSPRVGLILGPQIDLRLLMNHWNSGFYVRENGRESLQFFDEEGQAIHKIYRTEATDSDAWEQFLREFIETERRPLTLRPPQPSNQPPLPENFDRHQFMADWEALTEIHQYHGMLKRHGLSRTQALTQIGSTWANELNLSAITELFYQASDSQCPVIIFVGNTGCIQIYTGTVNKIYETGSWINVLDEEFNLHLDQSQIASAWLIKRPTEDGPLHSIECFNAAGESIITLFGKRRPGQQELPQWRELVTQLLNTER